MAISPSPEDDIIIGTVGPDTINALEGNDTVSGLTGNDDLDGGPGNDTVNGDEGDDTLRVGGTGTDTANGGVGDDTLVVDYRTATTAVTSANFPSFNLTEGGFNGSYASANGDRRVDYTSIGRFDITTGSGNDEIRIAGGRSIVSTGAGDDIVNLGASDPATDQNQADGGSGVDGITANFTGSNAAVNWNIQTNTFNGNAAKFVNFEYFELLELGGGNDVIVTGSVKKNETVTLGAGNDFVTVVDGFDTVRGGSGFDTLIVDYSGSTNTVENGSDPAADSSSGNGGFLGFFLGRGEPGSTRNDRTVGYEGIERFEVTTGSGDDRITTATADDIITTGAGNDRLNGGAGADLMTGGTGNDLYFVDSFGDVVVELTGEGTDEVRTPIGSRTDFSQLYLLPDNVENLTGTSTGKQGVWGNGLDNVIIMGTGNDLVVVSDRTAIASTAGGNDTVRTGAGNDFIFFGGGFNSLDIADGGAGTDTLGLLGNYSITFTAENLVGIERLALFTGLAPDGSGTASSFDVTTVDANVAAGQTLMVLATSLGSGEALVFDGAAETDGAFNIRSGAGADTLAGGAMKDRLNGAAGDDQLFGLGGNDTLIGGLGTDLLRGGSGKDFFRFETTDDSTTPAGREDKIADFQIGLDKIDVSAIDANEGAEGNQSFLFVGSAAFSSTAGELRSTAVGDTGKLWLVEGDTDGDGAADFAILVTTITAQPLTAADFIA